MPICWAQAITVRSLAECPPSPPPMCNVCVRACVCLYSGYLALANFDHMEEFVFTWLVLLHGAVRLCGHFCRCRHSMCLWSSSLVACGMPLLTPWLAISVAGHTVRDGDNLGHGKLCWSTWSIYKTLLLDLDRRSWIWFDAEISQCEFYAFFSVYCRLFSRLVVG